MNKVKIGVVGVYRGMSMINFCKTAPNAEIVAICDKNADMLAACEAKLEKSGEAPITCYTSFDEFLRHDMDAVVLANYANAHAPLAIRCLEAGKHVYSEVLPVQTMREAVLLVEAVERSGKVYAYGENFCYMPGPYRIRRLYREGALGEFEYGEGEYVHNLESVWPSITYGEEKHWRNNYYATFYCTHSIGPLIHITGLRPVSVVGFEGGNLERNLRVGCKSGSFGVEMIKLDNGGIIKSVHGGLYRDSVWYCVYGSKGRAETAREDALAGGVKTLYADCDEYSGQYGESRLKKIDLAAEQGSDEARFGHDGSDYVIMSNFVGKILGDPNADVIGVYEALNMFLPGMFAYRSILQGGAPVDIPDMRDIAQRDAWRNDTMCTDPDVAGDMLIPSFSRGNPEIPAQVYENVGAAWKRALAEKTGYVEAALTAGEAKK